MTNTKIGQRRRVSRATAAWAVLRGGSVVYGVRVGGTLEVPPSRGSYISHVHIINPDVGRDTVVRVEEGATEEAA